MRGPEGIGVGFLGLGAYLPPKVRTNDAWPPEFQGRRTDAHVQRDVVAGVEKAAAEGAASVDPEVIKHSAKWRHDPFRGSRERRVIDDDMPGWHMEVLAARRALEASGTAPEDVTALYTFNHLPDHVAPLNHSRIHRDLGLTSSAYAMTVSLACASFLPMVSMASRMVAAGEHDRALVTVGAPLSRITNYQAPSSVFTGDGAVAAVVGPTEPGFGYIGQAVKTYSELAEGLGLHPVGAEDVPWYRGDVHQSRILIAAADRAAAHAMGGRAASMCRVVCHELLERYDLTPDDVDFVILPQSTAWFADALAEGIGIDPSRKLSYEDHFVRYGHLLVASVALNAFLAHQAGRLKKGDLVLAYSPGLGFTTAAMLYRWNLEPPQA